MMLVPAKPLLQLVDLKSGNDFAPPWSECSFFSSGCDALAYALYRLDLPVGSEVVLPALICRTVPDRIKAQGFSVVFVDSAGDHPAPSIESILQACKRPLVRALVLVDFFGFMPPAREEIIKAVQTMGCLVIEDRCHSALLRPDVECADAVIYSLRKILPSSDGGAIWFSAQSLRNRLPSAKFSFRCARFVSGRLLERFVCSVGLVNIYAPCVNSVRNLIRRARSNSLSMRSLMPPASPIAPSWVLNRQLHNPSLLSEVARKRHDNYQQLSELTRTSPLFAKFKDEDVPLVYPVLDVTGGLVRYLREHGVGASRWPGDELPQAVANSPNSYPNAQRFNKEIVCLPIHQSLMGRHIRRIASLIQQYSCLAT